MMPAGHVAPQWCKGLHSPGVVQHEQSQADMFPPHHQIFGVFGSLPITRCWHTVSPDCLAGRGWLPCNFLYQSHYLTYANSLSCA